MSTANDDALISTLSVVADGNDFRDNLMNEVNSDANNTNMPVSEESTPSDVTAAPETTQTSENNSTMDTSKGMTISEAEKQPVTTAPDKKEITQGNQNMQSKPPASGNYKKYFIGAGLGAAGGAIACAVTMHKTHENKKLRYVIFVLGGALAITSIIYAHHHIKNASNK